MINNEIFYLFAIISVGYILGNIKVRGFSLDVTAMLIVALIAGHYGMVISDAFQYFGLGCTLKKSAKSLSIMHACMQNFMKKHFNSWMLLRVKDALREKI